MGEIIIKKQNLMLSLIKS